MPLRRLLTGHGDPVTAHAAGSSASASASTSAAASASSAMLEGGPAQRVRDRPAAVVASHRGRAAAAGRLGGARPPGPAARRRRGRRAAPTTARATASRRPRWPRRRRRRDAPSRLAFRDPAPTPRGERPCTSQPTRSPTLLTTCATCSTWRGGWRWSPAAPAASGWRWRVAFAARRRRRRGRQPQGRRLRGGRGRAAGRGRPGARRARAMSATGTTSSALVETAYGEFGRVDVLVNNAGVAPVYPSSREVTEELFDKVDRRQPQGPVPARRARRRADGRRPTGLDHQRLEHRRGPADGGHRALRRRQGRASTR